VQQPIAEITDTSIITIEPQDPEAPNTIVISAKSAFTLPLESGTADTSTPLYRQYIQEGAEDATSITFKQVNSVDPIVIETSDQITYSVTISLDPEVFILPIPIDVDIDTSADSLDIVIHPSTGTITSVWFALSSTALESILQINIINRACQTWATDNHAVLHVFCFVDHVQFASTTSTRVNVGTITAATPSVDGFVIGFIVQAANGNATVLNAQRISAGSFPVTSPQNRRRAVGDPVYTDEQINAAYDALMSQIQSEAADNDLITITNDVRISYPNPSQIRFDRITAASGIAMVVFNTRLSSSEYKIIMTDQSTTAFVHTSRNTSIFLFSDVFLIQLNVDGVYYALFDLKPSINADYVVPIAGAVITGSAYTTGQSLAFDAIAGDTLCVPRAMFPAIDTSIDDPLIQSLSESIFDDAYCSDPTHTILNTSIFFPYHVHYYVYSKASSASIIVTIVGIVVGVCALFLAILSLYAWRKSKSSKTAPITSKRSGLV
jgi:hypothetical protein